MPLLPLGSRGTSDPHGEEVFDWVISSNLDIPTLLHRSSDIFFAPSSLALFCSWEVLQDFGYDHLPILLTFPLSPVFRPNERPPPFNFHKARWDDFASYYDFHCPSAEEYSFLSSAAAIFTSLTLNVVESSIPFGRIKRHPKAWCSAEVEEAVSERRKAEAWQTTCSSLSPKSNLKSPSSLFFALSLFHLPPLLISPTVPLPRSWLRFSPIT